MSAGTEIKIEGLREFQASMRAIDKDLPKGLRVMFNDVVTIVANAARPSVPTLSGAAAASIKPQSTQRVGQVKAGGARVPYYAWLDFGGRAGHVHRPFIKTGRYLFPAYKAHKPEIETALEEGLMGLARGSGLVVE